MRVGTRLDRRSVIVAALLLAMTPWSIQAADTDPALIESIGAILAEQPVETLRIQPAALQDDPREDFYFVIDVRPRDEFKTGFIPGAVNLPYHELTSLLERLPEGRDEAILLYCDTALRSMQALLALRLMGYRDVWYLTGGLNRWREEGRPLQQSTEETAH
ncbi:MAG: rhodanese-like domain-containing protein [Sphingobacteriia bacterium]|nr:rhodanese-like domain-containing protein [Sphingobacteriia bacterium]NCC39575.1 rhodanese-like domain-containing protein [Gammaproteobacteria bacterium]